MRIPAGAAIPLAMAGGAAFGLLAPDWARGLAPVSSVFLRLIRSIVAPLLFGVLVSAMAGAGSLRGLGRLGLRTLIYFEAVTTLALLIGWGAVALFRPGDGVVLKAADAPRASAMTFADAVERSFPASLFEAMARGDVLQIVVFCLLFGLAVNAVGGRGEPVRAFCEALTQVSFRYTSIVMYAAPAGVFAAMAAALGEGGLGVLAGLGRFTAVAWAAQLFYAAAVLLPVLLWARVPLRAFARAAREPVLVGAGTTSSAAALPATLASMREFGVPERVLGLVVPLGLSFNAAGSTIHLAMAAFFVAQAAGRSLPSWEQAAILLTLKLTSKGVAGIPRANFVILGALFGSFQLPMEGLAMLLGVDAAIDMVRTGVNVLGHCVAPTAIARWEGASRS